MSEVYLILGGNQGNVRENFKMTMEFIEQHIGNIVKKSKLYKTAAWGKTNQPDFLNQVIQILTNKKPEYLLQELIALEKSMGRIRNAERWNERTIDIDILFYNDLIINTPTLQIPHPHIASRRFVLVPLCEIAPQLKHPAHNKTTEELLHECPDKLEVKLLA